jgi:hypothetical protein
MGAALKSTNKGRLPDRAFANATSTSLFHSIDITFSFRIDRTTVQLARLPSSDMTK